MRRYLAVVIAMALPGCAASGPPLVDMTDIDPVVYQRDLDHCEAVGNSSDAVGPLVAGAIMGLSVGAGLGAMFGAAGAPGATYTTSEAIGTGAGAAAGAVADTAANSPSSQKSDPAARPTVAQCLTARGYKVTGGGS